MAAMIFLFLALICFILVAVNAPFPPRVNPLGLGLAFLVLATLWPLLVEGV